MNALSKPENRKWTVMVYIAGDSFLDSSGFADLKEMRRAGFTRDPTGSTMILG
jgi:hypothetical protein